MNDHPEVLVTCQVQVYRRDVRIPKKSEVCCADCVTIQKSEVYRHCDVWQMCVRVGLCNQSSTNLVTGRGRGLTKVQPMCEQRVCRPGALRILTQMLHYAGVTLQLAKGVLDLRYTVRDGFSRYGLAFTTLLQV